jgi:hypothetical protein
LNFSATKEAREELSQFASISLHSPWDWAKAKREFNLFRAQWKIKSRFLASVREKSTESEFFCKFPTKNSLFWAKVKAKQSLAPNQKEFQAENKLFSAGKPKLFVS